MNPMEQLVFDLVPPEPPSFASFLPGRNAEVVAALARFASDEAAETGVVSLGRVREQGNRICCGRRCAAALDARRCGRLCRGAGRARSRWTLNCSLRGRWSPSTRSTPRGRGAGDGSLRSSTRCSAGGSPVRRRRDRPPAALDGARGRAHAPRLGPRLRSHAARGRRQARRAGELRPPAGLSPSPTTSSAICSRMARRDMTALLGALAALDRHSLATAATDHGADAARMAAAGYRSSLKIGSLPVAGMSPARQ